MVKETRIVVTPGDVLCVRITCPRCRNAVQLTLSNEEPEIKDRCPLCSHLWNTRVDGLEPIDVSTVQSLIGNLRRLTKREATYIELEFKDTEQR